MKLIERTLLLDLVKRGRMKRTIFYILVLALYGCQKPLAFHEAVQKADSCYMAQDYKLANSYYKQAFNASDAKPQSYHYSNAAAIAAMAGDEQTAFIRLNQLISNDKEWYTSNFAENPDFLPLHQYPEWQVLKDTVEQRQQRIEKDYNHELIARLQNIFLRDQEPRHAFLFACQTAPDNQALRDSLIHAMQQADEVNLQEIRDIFDTYGFPSKTVVGSANSVIWLVVQHSDLDTQKEFYPFLRKAAEQGELSMEDMALLEDRIALFEGKPQRYGSQIVEDSTGERVIYTLLNTDSVDIWRSAAGMPPLEEYAKQMNAKWNK